MPWCHLRETTETNFQSNFKPQTRQDTMTPRGVETTTPLEDSISSLILSQKPGKTPRHHGVGTTTPRGGHHDTTGWKP